MMKSLLSVLCALAFLRLSVGMASTARAGVTCNGALFLTVTQPTSFIQVGDEALITINLGSGVIEGGTSITINRVRYELDCNHLFALGVPCTDQGDIMSYDFTQTVSSGGVLVVCQGLTWTATTGSSPNEVVFTPDTPIVLPSEQTASPTQNNCFFSFNVRLDNYEATSGPTSDDTPREVEVVAGLSTGSCASPCGRSPGRERGRGGGDEEDKERAGSIPADATCDNGLAWGVSTSSGIFTSQTSPAPNK